MDMAVMMLILCELALALGKELHCRIYLNYNEDHGLACEIIFEY